MTQACNLQLSLNARDIQIQAATDMANVLLVFGYKVNLVITDGMNSTGCKHLKQIDTQLIDNINAVILTDDTLLHSTTGTEAEAEAKKRNAQCISNQTNRHLTTLTTLTHVSATTIPTRSWSEHILSSHTTLQF